jgi:DNA-binding HxlR family transcriptional regulator
MYVTTNTPQEGTWMKPRQPHLSENCRAVSEVLGRVGDKWSVLIITMLGNGPRRFNELKRMVDGISQRMLTLSLRGLERDGLLTRTVTPSTPPRVDYELTTLGRSLLGPVSTLSAWALKNRADIQKARENFDA